MLPMRKTWSFSLFLGLFVVSGLVAADDQGKKKATIVETRSEPRCYGLDCPPLPTAPLMAFCFQVADAYYTATDRSWGFRWANKAMKFRDQQGQPVHIYVTNKEINAVGRKVKDL